MANREFQKSVKRILLCKKLHYRVNDGSSVIYYPTGYIAVSQSHSGLPCGGVYTNVFSNSPEPSVLATFTPFGHGSICHLNSNTTALVVDEEGGMMTEEDGTIKKQWKWIQGVKLNEPILIQVNEFIVIRIAGVNTASLSYRWQQEAVHVSLSSLQNAKPLHSNELGLILTDVKLSSKTGRELSKTNKQKIMEKEARRKFMEKKMTIAESKISDLVKTLEIPEDDFSHLQGLKYFQELKKLQRKVKNILDDWMEHYRIATGISSPDIQKMSNTPQMIQAIRKTQSAALPTLGVAEEEEEETGKCTSHDEGFSRFLSAPARNIRWDPPKSALSSCTQKENKEAGSFSAKLQSKPGLSLSKGSENIRSHMTIHKACPVSLRNALLKDGTPKRCRCSNHQIPLVSDVEYDDFIQGQIPGIEQILVMCVVSSSALKNSAGVDILEELYEKKNKNRSMPCEQSRLDSFRLVKYDINTAGSVTDWHDCLLVRRHNVAPGMFLMYICGKLLFADYIFNGYSNSIKDLQKQIAKSRGDYRMGFRLPSDFRFSPHSEIPPEKKLMPAESAPGIESRKCKDWPLKHDCCVQETDRTASVQDSAALNMSKRSHLLCDRINNHPPPLSSVQMKKGLLNT
ncbi:uncharacterized protein C3orf20-like [Erpetoichthys calabaricus]|uniref:uncharacterized protein C3orf20-like n=1 Tax=Erpetoichthys calabaricus TaxID=27687 RepID=UPI00223492D6|nr:uncharacterized protein C3orf20-like [Erpetoichthys calabaricus]